MTAPRPITLRFLATKAGVSRQTVSDALSGGGRVAPATRARVQRLAKKFGYCRDPLVAAGMAQMRRRQSNRLRSVLAFVETGPEPDLPVNYAAYRLMLKGMRERASGLGYGLEVFWMGTFQGYPGRLEGILRSRGIEGVLLLYVHDWFKLDAKPLAFDPAGFACATVGARPPHLPLHCARADHYADTRLALRSLASSGRKRVGLVYPKPMDDLLDHAVSSAFLGWHQPDFAEGRGPVFCNFDNAHGREVGELEAWCEAHRLDAIYGTPFEKDFDRVAAKLGPKLCVANFDREDTFKCSGLVQAHGAVGAAAVDIVDGQLKRGERGLPPHARSILVEGSWHA
jgi:LacI family transcriptional regulator